MISVTSAANSVAKAEDENSMDVGLAKAVFNLALASFTKEEIKAIEKMGIMLIDIVEKR